MKKLIFTILLISNFGLNFAFAQSTSINCACCSKNYSSFDFWLGDWEVFNTDGKLVGTNSITKKYDNCVVQEKWISKGLLKGTSYNFFDKSDGTWNQIWVDNTGYVLQLKGHFKNNSMVLKSELLKGEKGNYYNQISWITNKNGTVTQLWEIFNEKKEKISESFRGIYKKKLN